MNDFWTELKRRNVFKVGVAYGVLSWFILQVGSVLAPILGIPQSMLSYVVFVLVLGFPLAILFAWAFELTPEGIKREREVDRTQSITRSTGHKLNFAIIVLLVIAVAFLIVDNYLLDEVTDRLGEPAGSAAVARLRAHPDGRRSGDPRRRQGRDWRAAWIDGW